MTGLMYNRIIAHSILESKGNVLKEERIIKMEKYGKPFKEMSSKEKSAHIWEYYRWHIIAVIIGTIVVGSFVRTMLTPKKVYDVDIIVAGKLMSDETQPDVIKSFEEKFNASINFAVVDFANMGQMEMVMMQKIPLLIRTKELDLLVLSKDAFMSYLNQGGREMFMPLENVEELKPLLESKKDSLITSKDIVPQAEKEQEPEGTEEEDHIYGIRVDGLDNVPCIKQNEEFVIGVTSVVKNIPKTAEMIDYLVK